MNTKVLLTALCFLTVISSLWASPKITPSCHTSLVSFVNNTVILNNKQAKALTHVYILHNTSKQTYWLGHQGGQMHTAGWDSQIDPGHWSAILMDQPNFKLNCSRISSGKTTVLNCKTIMEVCELKLPQQKLPADHYWLTENQVSFKAVLIEVKQRLATENSNKK